MASLSIIIPAHNEETRIIKTLTEYTNFFDSKMKNNYELLVIPNGCTDNTIKLVSDFSKKHDSVKYKILIPGGKGIALIEGFKLAKKDIIGFTDADNSTNPKEFYKLVQNIDSHDCAIASRWMKDSVVNIKQPLPR